MGFENKFDLDFDSYDRDRFKSGNIHLGVVSCKITSLLDILINGKENGVSKETIEDALTVLRIKHTYSPHEFSALEHCHFALALNKIDPAKYINSIISTLEKIKEKENELLFLLTSLINDNNFLRVCFETLIPNREGAEFNYAEFFLTGYIGYVSDSNSKYMLINLFKSRSIKILENDINLVGNRVPKEVTKNLLSKKFKKSSKIEDYIDKNPKEISKEKYTYSGQGLI